MASITATRARRLILTAVLAGGRGAAATAHAATAHAATN
jgi:hypothetical protein